MYVCMYVCMYKCMYVCMYFIICSFLIKNKSYLYHIGEPQRDEEIDIEERDGEVGKTETMYVCMSGSMCMGRGWYLC